MTQTDAEKREVAEIIIDSFIDFGKPIRACRDVYVELLLDNYLVTGNAISALPTIPLGELIKCKMPSKVKVDRFSPEDRAVAAAAVDSFIAGGFPIKAARDVYIEHYLDNPAITERLIKSFPTRTSIQSRPVFPRRRG